jgi:hypothetical protein
VRALGADIEREAAEAIVPLGDATVRLHRGGSDPIEDEFDIRSRLRRLLTVRATLPQRAMMTVLSRP